jgi:hypothetical protein
VHWISVLSSRVSDSSLPHASEHVLFHVSPRSSLFISSNRVLTLRRMKILLHALLTAFRVELAVPAEQIKKKTSIVTRPVVTGRGNAMPLIVRKWD